jgi:hypothetical protein
VEGAAAAGAAAAGAAGAAAAGAVGGTCGAGSATLKSPRFPLKFVYPHHMQIRLLFHKFFFLQTQGHYCSLCSIARVNTYSRIFQQNRYEIRKHFAALIRGLWAVVISKKIRCPKSRETVSLEMAQLIKLK